MNVDRPGRSFRLPWKSRKAVIPHDKETMVSRRIPLLGFLPLNVKNHFIAMLGEFVGTFLFLLFAFGGTNAVNTAPLDGRSPDLAADPAKLLFISLCFGFSLAVNAWVFFRISGGLFNPAVSLAMMIVGAVPYLRGGLVIISQMLGSIAAAAVIRVTMAGPTNVLVSIGGGISVVQALFIEMFLTAMLVFTIFMLAAEKHKGTFIAPVGIGLALFIAELWGVYYTGGALNPARAFGPCVVAHDFYDYHWIYWVGPALGSVLASAFYMFIKALEYETVNPDQDDDKAVHFDPSTANGSPRPAYSPSQYARHHAAATSEHDLRNGAIQGETPGDKSIQHDLRNGQVQGATLGDNSIQHDLRNGQVQGTTLGDNSIQHDGYGNGPYIETGRADPLP